MLETESPHIWEICFNQALHVASKVNLCSVKPPESSSPLVEETSLPLFP